jgi:hypothetical protein
VGSDLIRLEEVSMDAHHHGSAADAAMGLELEASELESELEWAEAQGRTADAERLRGQLSGALVELAEISEELVQEPARPEIHAPRADGSTAA